jgi:aspartyl-tRNA(Asn)/glutamyl-tRNA(Gln) amidotransferase subunit A
MSPAMMGLAPALHEPSDWADDPVAALEARLALIAERNPQIHAFLTIDAPGARAAAQAARPGGRARSPVDGMPIGIKANIAVKGWPFHAGIGALRDRLAGQDAACVARLRAGGAVLLGLLNMDEAALGDTTDNAHFGRTQNPRQAGFTAGGSSGGAGAAVAAGFCAAAIGTDTLGSVRIPAAYCGITGHKPPHGALSTEGVVPLAPPFDTVGIVARTPAIAATLRHWLGAAEGGAARNIAGTLGVFPLDGTTATAATRDAVAHMADKAQRHGMAVQTVTRLDHEVHDIAKAAFLMVALSAAELHAADLTQAPAGFSPALRSTMAWAQAQPSARRHAAQAMLTGAAEQIRQVLAPYAAVLMPTTPQPAFAFGAPRPGDTADFTSLANIAGLAATAFPAGAQDGNIALSVQLVGADELACLSLAQQLAA